MQDFAKPYLEAIDQFASQKKEKLELILIGGLSLSFYGIPRHTIDIDAEVHCDSKIFYELIDYLKKHKVAFNISNNISGWGIIPLPAGYAGRAKAVHEGKYVTVKILDPADFVFSKLTRGTEEDFNDALEVIKKRNITEDALEERKKLISFPQDPETLLFRKKFEHLLGLMKI